MVVVLGNLFQHGGIHLLRKLAEMEHRIVLAVFAKESGVFAEVHILKVVRDKTSITTLDAFTEVCKHIVCLSGFHKAERRFYHTAATGPACQTAAGCVFNRVYEMSFRTNHVNHHHHHAG